MGRRKWSEADQAEAAELREEGLTFREIKVRLAARGVIVSEGVISWHCLRLGADAPLEMRRPCVQRTAPAKRGNYMVRPFTPEEDETILRLSGEGARVAEISRALSGTRKHNSILGRMMTLARRDARAEEAIA